MRAMSPRAIPILPCVSIDETIRFYGRLGFALEFEQSEPGAYFILAHGELVLHFALHPELDPSASHAACYLEVADADALWAIWSTLGLPEQGVPRLGVPEDKEWGMREFALVDPSGTLLRVGHEIG